MADRNVIPHKMVSCESGGILKMAPDRKAAPAGKEAPEKRRAPGIQQPAAPKATGQPSSGSLSHGDATAFAGGHKAKPRSRGK